MQIESACLAPMRQAWRTEAQLNKWLAEPAQLRQVSKLAGYKLELLQLEASLNHGRVDLLCTAAKESSPVVIEAKFGAADLDHFGRLLCYVDEVAAKAGIYVAEDFSQQIIDTSRNLPVAIHLIKANVSKLGDNSMCCVFTSVYSPKSRKRLGNISQLCSTVALVDSAKLKEALVELIKSARKAKLLARSSIVIEQDSIPQCPKNARTALLVIWPNQPSYADLADTMNLLQRHKATVLLVLMRSIDQAAADKLSCLARIASDISLRPLMLQPYQQHKWRVQQCDLAALATDSSGRSFWQKVAQNLSKHALQVQAVSEQGVFVASTKSQIRMVAFHQAKPRRLCVELRVGDENQFIAEAKFTQLKEYEGDIATKLAGQFEIHWLAGKVRANDHVLRLAWKKVELAQPEKFSEALIEVHQALRGPVAALKELDW